ncbi:glycoside hydrolase family 53 protein [Blautia sp. AF19-13LB]|uniref:glycoside hydrolase family 53 protein n=1 Tax=Blautia sp. AF19-13LB TaxID=2292962 RepID=UPI000E49910D|nr:glycosyl hydrolase 53 family protein [Blautia sp. AF19-13LB]RHR28568.1 arabinogalactan endo-1,4-beta-galactosidase [Blautia sp. AF19-13LB]
MKRNIVSKAIMGLALGLMVLAGTQNEVKAERSNADYSDFIRGADVSMLKDIEDLGGEFYDNGVKKDALEIMKNHGANYVRLRLWVDPYDSEGNSYGGGSNDFNTTLYLAKRAQEKGMKVLIDFHLSDYWADPGTQSKPKAWENLSYDELKTTLYNYMKNTLNDFKNQGVVPDMVQVGNETSSGILWDEGKIGGDYTDFTQLAELLNQAISGVRASVGNQTKIVLHLDNGGNNSLYRWWFDGVTGCGFDLDFDIIGLTYYPMWHGTMDDLQYNLNDISARYNKDVMIVETAYAFTLADGDGLGSSFSPQDEEIGGYPASVQGQKDFMSDLESVILNVPGNRGLGFFYWEPEWIPVEGAYWGTEAGKEYIEDNGILSNPWDNLALFDFNGNTLESIDIFQTPEQNLVTNPGFEIDGYTNSPTGWNVWLDDGVNGETVKTEGNGFDGNYKLSFWNESAYGCSIYQTVTGLENGTYTLSAWVMTNANQTVNQLYVKNYGGEEMNQTLPVSDLGWNKVVIDNIQITNGQCELGIYSIANGGDWCNIDNVMLRKK